jgi:hypothetical protein
MDTKCVFRMKGENRIQHRGRSSEKKCSNTSVLLPFKTFGEFNTFPLYNIGNYRDQVKS